VSEEGGGGALAGSLAGAPQPLLGEVGGAAGAPHPPPAGGASAVGGAQLCDIGPVPEIAAPGWAWPHWRGLAEAAAWSAPRWASQPCHCGGGGAALRCAMAAAVASSSAAVIS
jgi:hypothetical protein